MTKKMHKTGLLFVIFVVCSGRPALADTLQVPGEFKTIQSALARAKKGDVVLVNPGVYSEMVRLKPGIILRSAGDESKGKLGLKRAEETIIDGKSGSDQSAVVMAADSVLDGFTIRNVGVYDDDKWLYHHQTQGNEQEHEHIGRPTIAPIMVTCKSCTVKNNIVHHNGFSGILINGKQHPGSQPLIENNVCFRNMGAGISAMNLTVARIKGNRCFENFYAGIGQNNASPHIVSNLCYKNIRAGIGISNGSCPTVEQNRCYENRRAGIGSRTKATTRPTIRNNECFRNDMAGIGSEENSAPVIVDNHCYENKLAGIGCRDHASPSIVGNRCEKNGKAGIGCDSDSSALIVGNECKNNQAAGIGFAPCKNGHAKVLNNRLIDNKLVAIGIHKGWDVYFAGNYAHRFGGMPPLVMVHAGAVTEFVDNHFVGGGVASIRCAGQARIRLCKLAGFAPREKGPPNFGIWALPGAEIDCRESVLSNWRHGLYANNAFVQLSDCRIENSFSPAINLVEPKNESSVVGNEIWTVNRDVAIVNLEPRDNLEIKENTTHKVANKGK